jgi:hypothetical protein
MTVVLVGLVTDVASVTSLLLPRGISRREERQAISPGNTVNATGTDRVGGFVPAVTAAKG